MSTLLIVLAAIGGVYCYVAIAGGVYWRLFNVYKWHETDVWEPAVVFWPLTLLVYGFFLLPFRTVNRVLTVRSKKTKNRIDLPKAKVV